jgi:spore germination cell wall hydrolase CwlJ-like protein
MAQYADARKVAEQVYLGNIGDVTKGAKFYHANYVSPGWNLRRVITIGDHIFYR